jgi:sphinganine-1-phosphate aldolase
VIDEMKVRGWYVQPQLGFQDSKENIHLSVNPASVGFVEAMLADLDECVREAKTMPSGGLAAKIRESFGALDPASLAPESFAGLLGMAGVEGAALPGRMAEINEVLNALDAPLRERLLIEYLNELYRRREG